MTTVLEPDREDRDRLSHYIRRGAVTVLHVSGSSVHKRFPARRKKDEWDKQIEEDLEAGKLDELIREARRDHREGTTKPLP
jgi:hypothetical protein